MKRLLLTLVIVASAASARAGWEFTQVSKVDGGRNSGMMNSTSKALVDGDRARIEFVESGNPMMQQGDYLLTKDAGKTVYLVDPKEKSYATWDIQAMMGMAGGMMKMMNMQFTNPKVEKLVDEDGGKLLGFPTRHYKFVTTYGMEMSFMGMKQSSQTRQEEEVWTTSALTDGGVKFWLNQGNLQTGNEQLDAMIKAEMSKAQGFPLKRVMTQTTTDSKGKQEITRQTSEVTAITKASPAASAFEIPAGYRDTSAASSSDSSGEGNSAAENPFLKMMKGMKK